MFTRKPLVSAIALALVSGAAPLYAATDATANETVVITGIRASQQQSIAAKKNAMTNVEVVTAEDVGKMPDKNIADSLSRLAGVNIAYGAAFAFDEAERVQIRGTPTKLNLVTINGHSLSSGDWYLGDQSTGTRSVGFGLLPSQLIGQSIVYKNGQADITEGGIAGTINVVTRKPLDFKAPLTAEAALGGVYSTKADKVDGQLSVLANWKNASNTFGVLVQGFKEDRHLRRDGLENFGSVTLLNQDAANPTKCFTSGGQQYCGNADLKGKRVPQGLFTSLFQGERTRTGGFISAQFRPNAQWDLALSGFHSELEASNTINNSIMWMNQLNLGGLLTNTKVNGDVVTSATLIPNPVRVVDLSVPANLAAQGSNNWAADSRHQNRLGAGSTAAFYDFDVKFRQSDKLSWTAKIGHTEGTGETQASPGVIFRAYNKPISYDVSGTDGFSWTVQNLDQTKLNTADWKLQTDIQGVFRTLDKETYAYLDGKYDLDRGIFTKLSFGGRASKHFNERVQTNGAWNFKTTGTGGASLAELQTQFPSSSLPFAGAGSFPADFLDGVGGNFPRDAALLDMEAVRQFGLANINYDPVLNRVWTGGAEVREKNTALYLMSDFEHGDLSGNMGVRWVNTDLDVTQFTALAANRVCPALAVSCPTINPNVAPVKNPISSSRMGGYMPVYSSTDHNALLPSLNLRWAPDGKLVVRGSLSRTMARPEYSELGRGTSFNLTATPKFATTGNPYLQPIMANNADASVAYYFGTRAYVQAGIFGQKLQNYVKAGTAYGKLINPDTQLEEDFELRSFRGVRAKVRGVELSGETPIGKGFGIIANATYVDGEDQDKAPLLNASKLTYNLRGYFENDTISASLAWNHRSEYATGFFGNGTVTGPSTTAARNGMLLAEAQGSLSLSASYKFTDNFRVTLDANNLTDPQRKYYILDEAMPWGYFKNGRQYYLTARLKY
ncbi:TonB-dependent receptor [Chitinimonas sp. BJYL2]|uniref:TonB-dependent receptor n=1 Tax=Chitinimonas sp. BJYL2 TaxID=2976696 RepID=UPI0022B3A7C0|nr:TonB-dependent receptor [Chitinimonas sp. BJYL2]